MSTPVEDLRVLLDQVCDARQATSTAAVVKLEDNLLTNKQRLIDLLQDKPKTPEHRKSLEAGKLMETKPGIFCISFLNGSFAGKAFINGKEHRVNYDFIREAIYLSDHLNLDEYEASRLLYGGISQASTLNSTALDTAVYLYHSERGYVLAILNIILEAAKDETVENGIRYVLTKFMGDIVDEKPSSGTTFFSKIITSTKELSKIVSSISKFGMLESGKTAAENQQKIREAKYREEQQKNPQQAQAPANQLIGPDIPVAFKPETVKLRVDRLNEERISLVQILYHIATLYWLPEDDLLAIITKLQNMNLSDNTSSYMLTILLASISFEYNKQPHHRQGTNFSTNSAYLKKMHDQITIKPWKVDVLKAVVMIQWALFIEVLSNKSPDVTQNLAFDKNARIELVKSAISLGAFGFMNNYLLYFKQNTSKKDTNKKVMDINEDDSALEIDGLKVDPNDHTKFSPDINTDFQNNVICELENTMTTFIEAMSTFYSDFESRYSGVEEIIADKEYQDIVKDTLVGPLTVLASVYRNRLDAGLEFWDNSSIVAKFFAFLLGLKLPGNIHFPATLDFIGAISTGIKSADLSHSLFSIGTHIHNLSDSSLFSWGKYFYTLQFFYNKFQAHKSEEDMPPVFPPAEEEAIIKFTYLCQQVVQYSNKARKEIWETPAFEAHASIVNLINCPISTRLRAALYDLLAAFCSSWGGGIEDVGKRCAQAVWNTLERSDMIIPDKVMVPAEPPAPVTSTTTANTLFNGYEFKTTAKASTTTSKEQTPKLLLPEQPVGFLRVLEEEKSLHVYTQTQSVLHLLANIIHTPTKRDELIKAWGYIESSVPRLLGLDNNRTPGTSPYISLVVDHIFLKLKNLPYDNADTQWQLTDTCLTIIENSIMSFNIEPLCDYIRYTSKDVKMTGKSLLHTNLQPTLATEVASALQESLLTYITQPGYDVLLAILSGGSLVNEMFKIVAQGKEAIAQFKADKNDYFRNCLTRCLRIFSKVLKIQNAFVNVFLPQLHISSQKQPMGELKLGDYLFPSPPASLRSLSNLMLFNTEVIVQMALMVDCDDYEDICVLSASILSQLSSEPEDTCNDVKFHNYINVPMCGIGSRQLAGILLSSPGASSIIFGFSERLEVQTAEVTTYDDYEYDMNIIPFWLAEKTLFNVNRLDDFGDNYHHAWSIRITILDMLLKNLEKELKSPTITEFLLGFDVKELETHGIQHKSIPTDVESRSQLACLLSILETLSRGTGEEEDDNSRTEKPLIRTHPILAEKCYQLIYKLCVRESVSTATLHYLRTNCNDFLLKQFKSIACRLESSVGVSEPYFQGTLVSADETRTQTDFFTLVSVLNQRAWLLKLIALELHRTAHTFHRTGTPPLLKLLYGISEEVPSDQEALTQHMESMGLQSNTNYQQPLWNMLEIINSLDFAWKDELDEETTEPLSYYSGFNENNYTMQKDGYSLYDIRTIYKVLRQRQLTHPDCANMSPEQLKAVEAEMGRILKRLVAENRHIEIKNGKLHCLRAWKDVVEITIWDCFDSFSFETREKTIYELLSVLLPKLENGTGIDKGLSKELGEIVLILLSRLRRDKRRQAILQVTSGSLAAQHVLPEERLRWIFTSIIKCICKDKSTVQERRAMYSALVNLLEYASPDNSTRQKNTSFKNFQHFCEMHMEKLLDIVCGDVKNSGVAYETTAYSLLRALYSLLSKEKNSKIHQYLIKSNFLQYANDMTGHSNSELSKAIEDRDGK